MVSTSQPPCVIALLGDPVERITHPQSEWSQWDPTQQPVLLLNLPANEQDLILQAVRRDPVRYLQPIFCVEESPLSPMLADGRLPLSLIHI